jgi:hypothetical protein
MRTKQGLNYQTAIFFLPPSSFSHPWKREGRGKGRGLREQGEEAGPRGRVPQGRDRGRDARACTRGATNAAGGQRGGDGAAEGGEGQERGACTYEKMNKQ